VSYFQADGDNVDITVIPSSLLVMLRWPLLTSDEFPKGRLQPYMGVGPSFFYLESTADFTPTISRKLRDAALDVGLDVRSGLAWQFHKHFALFTEYRFSYLHRAADLEADPCMGRTCAGTAEVVNTTLSTHHFLSGVSFRF